MRLALAAIAGIILVAGIFGFLRRGRLESTPVLPPPSVVGTSPGFPLSTPLASPNPAPLPVPVVPAISPPPPSPPLPPEAPARIEADAIALNLRHFGQRFGGNPVGTNAEIVAILTGGNRQGVRYFPEEHLRLNGQGEAVDLWGTPYFFHQISARETEIRSAGPDRILWTSDDIVAK